MTIALTGISPLLLSISNAAELNSTQYLQKGQSAPFSGYLIDSTRLEKTIIALQDLESTKQVIALKTKYYEEKLQKEKDLADEKLAAQKKESEAVEKELKAKIADLDVWYKKPWVVAVGVVAVFIATGTLLP